MAFSVSAGPSSNYHISNAVQVLTWILSYWFCHPKMRQNEGSLCSRWQFETLTAVEEDLKGNFPSQFSLQSLKFIFSSWSIQISVLLRYLGWKSYCTEYPLNLWQTVQHHFTSHPWFSRFIFRRLIFSLPTKLMLILLWTEFKTT